MSRCSYCGKTVEPNCDWRQGRCPHRGTFVSAHHARFLNLIKFFKGMFTRG